MKYLPTWEERQELAQQRTARQRELLEQATALHQQIATQAQAEPPIGRVCASPRRASGTNPTPYHPTPAGGTAS